MANVVNMTIATALLCLVFSLASRSDALPHNPEDARTLVQTLFEKIAEEQVQTDIPFKPFKHFGKKKGAYNSEVKLNFHGNLEMAEIRRMLNVFDNNMFVTAWVTSSLLEASRHEDAPVPSDHQLDLALKFMSTNHDQNKPYNTSVMTFWQQVYNASTKCYQSTPTNLIGAIEMTYGMPIEEIEKILERLGFKQLAKDIESILEERETFARAFHIPPDFDDTFVNLGLGSLLYQMKDTIPGAWEIWSSQNTNISSVFTALKKYAYRPFSGDRSVNTIDTRTYFWIRGFLDEASAAKQDVALVSTWVQDLSEVRTLFYKGVAMPFQVNNVDATVAANTVYGITSSVLSGLVSKQVLDDPGVEQIYLNTTSLITYALKNNMINRPDLVLTYYPSQREFDWFVSRTFSEIVTARKKGPLPHSALETVYQMLRGALQEEMTHDILAKAQTGGAEEFYFDDFLGDGDLTHDNRTLVRGEDRIFTTAMAANALLYTWTEYNDKTGKCQWADVPENVRETIAGCINWLTHHTLDGNYDPWNAFFSGSAKGFSSLPFWYPANRFEYLNGTAIHDRSNIPNSTFVLAMEGHVSPQTYEQMVKQTHFGMPTPVTFRGYNYGDGYFPLWSSVPYTYSTTMLALARYNSIVG
ncbi:uncharacterized protein LOC101859330 [Aplysia californica]|uniref:Uncharacterized protein LOC101859330 n=1 Tax=Aplysia californica TaxID=6500 RepID=A0ABM1A041_APLCA|nr:uncharacterized protein LOC101859330 [Aplysia californica]